MQTCPDCKNQFVPFKCITCGAEKLYDATVKPQAAQILKLIKQAEGTLDEAWKEFLQDVLELSERDRTVVLIAQIVRLHQRCQDNHNLAITAFNA